MINKETMDRFYQLRQETFNAIEKELEEDGHCKSYEGTFGIIFPCYFEDDWAITLDMYLLGPKRHYVWGGNTLDEAIEKAEREIKSWIEQEE